MGRQGEFGQRPGWKPTMTPAEAEAWCAESAYRGPVYHATDRRSAAAIRRQGFDLARFTQGRVWGNGVYAAIDWETVEYYLRQFGNSGELLELRVEVRQVLRVRIDTRGVAHPLHQLLAFIPAGLRRLLDARLLDHDQPAALTRILVEEGYDALEIVADRFSPMIGGNQLVVFNPRAIVVVNDEDPPAT